MPPTIKQSPLAAKYGKKFTEAATKGADAPIDYGFQQVPGGIKNGIARLSDCTFGQVQAGKQNEGEWYFRAAGVIVEPKAITNKDGTRTIVEGMQTSIMEMVCETKTQDGKITTMEEHVANIQNELKKLDPDLDVTEPFYAAQQLKERAANPETPVWFKFSTTESKPQIDLKTGKPKINPTTGEPYEPRVFQNWYGSKGLEDYSPDMSDAVEDGGIDEGVADEPTSSDVQYSDSEDLDSLAKRADEGEDAAIDRLNELAANAGMSEDDITNAGDTWADVVTAMKNLGGSSPDDDAQQEDTTPEKGQIWKYQVIDPKTGKPAVDQRKKPKKPIDVEIKAVSTKNKTVDLLDCIDRKTVYKGVAWESLIPQD